MYILEHNCYKIMFLPIIFLINYLQYGNLPADFKPIESSEFDYGLITTKIFSNNGQHVECEIDRTCTIPLEKDQLRLIANVERINRCHISIWSNKDRLYSNYDDILFELSNIFGEIRKAMIHPLKDRETFILIKGSLSLDQLKIINKRDGMFVQFYNKTHFGIIVDI